MAKQLSWRQIPIETENTWPVYIRVIIQVVVFSCLFTMLVGIALCLIVASTHQDNDVTRTFLGLGLRLIAYPIAIQLIGLLAAAMASKVQKRRASKKAYADNRNNHEDNEDSWNYEDDPYEDSDDGEDDYEFFEPEEEYPF